MAIFQNQKYNSLPEQVQENKDNIEYLQENAMFQWNPLGAWSATKFYKKNDLVVDGDYGTFLCIKDTDMAGTEPKDNPNFWVKVIQAGKQGRPGEMGPRGNSIESVQTVSHSNTGDETVTRAQINFSLGNSNEISIYAKNGAKGNTGATGPQGLTGTGLSHITMGTPYISGSQTITPLTFEYTDGTTQELAAYAQNGDNPIFFKTLPDMGVTHLDLLEIPDNYFSSVPVSYPFYVYGIIQFTDGLYAGTIELTSHNNTASTIRCQMYAPVEINAVGENRFYKHTLSLAPLSTSIKLYVYSYKNIPYLSLTELYNAFIAGDFLQAQFNSSLNVFLCLMQSGADIAVGFWDLRDTSTPKSTILTSIQDVVS